MFCFDGDFVDALSLHSTVRQATSTKCRGLFAHQGVEARLNGITLMKSLLRSMRRFLRSEDGPTAVEYAVMLALIVIVCLAAIQTIGTEANKTFQKIGGSMQTANS